MLEVAAIKYNDTAPVFPIVRRLPPQGGTIGRADNNTIALPDPMRLLSRRHLSIERLTAETYQLTNISSSSTAQVNDTTLSPGASCALKHGDRICIGSYLLEVRISGQDSPLPFSGQALTEPAQNPQNAPATIDAILEQNGTSSLLSENPLGLASISEQTRLVDLAGDSGQLLADLGSPSEVQTLIQDPLLQDGNPLLGNDVLDPLALFGGEEKSLEDLLAGSAQSSALPSAALSHPVSELHTPFSPNLTDTTAQASQGGTVAPIKPPHAAKQEASLLIPEEFSLEDLLGVGGEPASHPPQQKQPVASDEVLLAPEPAPERILPEEATAPGHVQQMETTVAPAPDSALASLQAALLEGLNLKELPANRRLDADLMRTLGALLRSAIGGTLDLMAARATIKREVRANVTVIAPLRNNPLKFSPDADVALQYLLGRQFPGFMGAQEAIDEAFADLHSHQMGVVSGMRSALSLVLERFDPNTITRNSDTRGLIDSLLAMGRKARLWDAYKRYFENTREQAVDRFQEFFGAAFVDAYEEYAKAGNPQKNEAA